MDAFGNGTEYFFTSPVALMFQNGSSLDEADGYTANATLGTVAPGTNHGWKKVALTNGPQRLEKIGDTLRRELKWAFILHTYGFGCVFFILAFYTFFSVLNIRSFISSRPFMSTINGFLCLLGTSRAASLFIDPYNLKENMPKLIGQVLWDLGFPSIISAFCLVQLAFLQLTQLQIGPEGLRRKSCLSLIVTAHFLLTIGMDIIVASHENLMIVKHVVQYIFLTWGVFLCANFLYSGYKVMSMIRSIPGGLKHRDVPDPSYKGIMQLAILAPHNNLAGSMTAALLPTLCTPKIHQQDNVGLSTVGFRSDGNSRILESESIPMLEEMTGSSGEEPSPKQLTRGSSFQNQTRASQKFHLKPKLSLRSGLENEPRDEDFLRHLGPRSPKSPRNISPKSLNGRGTEFDFGVRSSNGILKNTETFVKTKNIYEFKSRSSQRNSFENENFCFASERKQKGSCEGEKVVDEAAGLIPDILISQPNGSEQGENRQDHTRNEKTMSSNDKHQENLNKIMNEITNDLNEMHIVREGKDGGRSEDVVQVHECSENELENVSKDGRREGLAAREAGCRKNSSKVGGSFSEDISNDRNITSSTLTDIDKSDETLEGPQNGNRRKKSKTLSWKKKDQNQDEENATRECLLPQENSADVSLRSVLNHIAYVNKGTSHSTNNEDDLEKIRKSKVEWVLNITYITAMWGLMLCLSNMGRIYSPFEVPESRKVSSSSNGTQFQPKESDDDISFSSWPWLWFQTFCRALELAMGCAMANITRQPTANYRYQRTLSLRHRNAFYSI